MIDSNEPYSDQWRRAALHANDLEAAASILENTRSAMLSQWMTELGDIAVNKAERVIKASPKWMDLNKRMVDARTKANAAEIEATYLKMKYYESASERADERTMARL